MQPSLFPFGCRVDEPVTTLTDLLVTAVCLYFWWKLSKISPKTPFLGWMRAYFITFGVSTFFGGICGHAFCHLGEFNLMKLSGWLPGMLATAFLARAAVELLGPKIKPDISKKIAWAIWLILGAMSAAMLWQPDFNWVKINGFLQVIGIVLPVSVFIFREKKHPGSRFFLEAIGVATLASLVFSLKISLGCWFNHADISHILLAVAAWFYFRGAVAFAKIGA